ncbi:MAG: ABC transporter permease subunit [Desulfobacteraceae bacterium]|nr:ABC transporter permease subunit [Desulfobacteraceae bacterium]MBC2757916.1 ABC transporter permease subunit [Desulfobacteraceae bacterium]
MTGMSWFLFVFDRFPELLLRTGEHLMLTGVSTAFAILIGIPLGICAARMTWLRGVVTGSVGILQTIPSLAMLAILLALLHKIGALPAIIGLILYALLPIVRNSLAGLEGISPEIQEAAKGIGMTNRQQLWMIEIPLAMPVIIAGIRTAAVVGIGIATLSAFIGAGGLGQFINRGLALSNTSLILLGAIPAAILALIVDGIIALFQWGVQRKGFHGRRFVRYLTLFMPVLLLLSGFFSYHYGNAFYAKQKSSHTRSIVDTRGKIRIGTKNFTEQLILGELMAQVIESQTGMPVDRVFNLGGTMICHEALISGEIDIYVEYTGTALTAILKQNVISDPNDAYEIVSREYRKQFNAEWLEPFGFNNTYAITVRKSDAEHWKLKTISDLEEKSSSLRAGFTAEFSERPDGYPGLSREYELQFKEIRDLDPAIMYQAIVGNEVDVICAFATDGRIKAYNLFPLHDDRNFFPPYYAAPIIRLETSEAFPEVRQALLKFGGALNDETMQKLNFAVDEEKQRVKDVAFRFLKNSNLLK